MGGAGWSFVTKHYEKATMGGISSLQQLRDAYIV